MKQKNIFLFLLLWMLPVCAMGQKIQLKVVDRAGNPLVGYAVSPHSQYRAEALTDENGCAELDGALKGRLVDVFATDRMRKTVRLDGEMTLVTLDEESSVVPLGFNNTVREIERTGAVASIGSDALRSSSNNPGHALYGKIPGLYVMQGDNLPWTNDPKFFVRGLATFNNATPLVLVDGYERPLRAISMEEIESITLLKDAASLAIYGMRGANGVILVRTKRGENAGMHVKVSYQFGVDTPTRMPEMADAYHYARAVNEALAYDGLERRYSNADLRDFYSGEHAAYFPNVDWLGEAIRDAGFNHELTASFRGGSKSVRYYSQISYNGSDGLIRPHDMTPEYSSQMQWDRLSARTNLDIDLTRTTRLGIDVLGQIEQHHRPAIQANTLFASFYNTPAAAFPVRTDSGMWGGDELHTNPIADLTARGYTDGVDRALYANMRLSQNLSAITEGLSVEAAIGFDNRASFWEGQGKTYAYEVLQVSRDEAGAIADVVRQTRDADTPLAYSSEVGEANMVTTMDAAFRYDRSWNAGHTIQAAAGYHMEENSKNGRNNTYRRQSLFLTAHYGFKERYFVDATLSYAGSSVLKKGDKFRFFPAVSASWVISREEFLKSSDVVDLLRLRASWGLTGSDLIAYGLSHYYFGGKGEYYFGNNNSLVYGNGEGTLPNLDLTCETAAKTNVGVDLQLFKGLTFTADAFYEDRRNILCPASNIYSGILGIGMADVNDGHVINYGVDLALNWSRTLGDWSYMLGGTFSFSRNEIINMNEGYQPYDYLRQTGRRIGQFFGLQATGFFRDEQDITGSPEHTFSTVSPGDVKYNDLNGDKRVDEYDRIAMEYSTTLPEIYYGFTLGVNWKGLGLIADFQGVTNYTLVKNLASYYRPLQNNTNVSYHYLENRWTSSNRERALYPRLSTLENRNNNQSSSIWQEDGSFLKLRNLEIGWTLPAAWSRRVRASQIRIFARGTNLFSVDYVKTLDPEMMYAGYPALRSYHLGINLTF